MAGDVFFNQDMIHDIGLTNASFMADFYHLFDSVLPKKFGQSVYNSIESQLRGMANANSELYFERCHQKARSILENRTLRDSDAEESLSQFANNRNTYALYCLKRTRGTRGSLFQAFRLVNHRLRGRVTI